MEAVRIEEKIQHVAVFFIPIPLFTHSDGKVGRCDFCEQPFDHVISPNEAPIDDWSPSNGLAELVEKLAPPSEFQIPDGRSDSSLHSLLAAAREASSVSGMDTSLGMKWGGILGAAMCVPTGLWLFARGFTPHQLDKVGCVFASVLIGGVLGAIGGALVQLLLLRRNTAVYKIDKACKRYSIDLAKLAELSEGYGPSVQKAVRSIQDRF